MNYYKISITTPSDKRDIVIALLSESQDFNGFEESEFDIKAFISEEAYDETAIQELSETWGFSFKSKLIPSQNWNVTWESNFMPIKIGSFCGIRADFHPSFTDVQYPITINPKMAFGTGHHETTLSMIEAMQLIDMSGKAVLDYGCGTGILAILASKMGASTILALDYDPLSYENTSENCQKNEVENIQIILGELNTVEASNFDLILANINKNVILENLGALSEKLAINGQLLISGILQADEEEVILAAQNNNLITQSIIYKGEWLAISFYHSQ